MREHRHGKRIEPFDVAVGHRIRVIRVQRGLSQTELGNALGVSFQQVQKYEKGTNRVGAGRLHAIAKTLDTSIGELCAEAASKHDPIDMLLPKIDTLQISAIVDMLKQLRVEQRAALKAFLATLVNHE